MQHSIHSRKLKFTFEFYRPSGGIYVYVAGLPGGDRTRQICQGGGLMGSTIMYTGDDDSEFEAICRRWYRAFMRNLDAYEY